MKPIVHDPPPYGRVASGDTRSNTVEDAARYERTHGPAYPVPVRQINGRLVEDPPSEDEL